MCMFYVFMCFYSFFTRFYIFKNVLKCINKKIVSVLHKKDQPEKNTKCASKCICKTCFNNNILQKNIYSISFLQLFSVVLSFFCLIYSFIISDFSNETVYNNSHTTKPIFYKISGTWGNHEGSLLLWLLVLTLFIFLFLVSSKNQPKKYRLLTLFFQQIIIYHNLRSTSVF